MKCFAQQISLKPISQEKLTALDEEVRRAHSAMPSSLAIRPITTSFLDASAVIMARIDFELLFQKTLCTLHRRPMRAGNRYSREVCGSSATSILTHLIDLRKGPQPGGQLAQDQWPMACCSKQDSLFGASLLCHVISLRRKDEASEEGLQESREDITMIREAYRATPTLNVQFKEAKRASTLLANMLSSLEQILPKTDVEKAAETSTTDQTRPRHCSRCRFPCWHIWCGRSLSSRSSMIPSRT